MFFSFEGIDGSGKSTQAHLLTTALRERGHDVLNVREPGGTHVGEQVRLLLLDSDSDIRARTELLLFSAARAQLVDEVIEPALHRGDVVIADRFFDSSTAYQGSGRGLADGQWMDELHHFTASGRAPDRTYLIDLSLAAAEARRQSRDQDRMEQAGFSFYQRVSAGYQELAHTHADRILVLDGSHTSDAIHEIILADAITHLA